MMRAAMYTTIPGRAVEGLRADALAFYCWLLWEGIRAEPPGTITISYESARLFLFRKKIRANHHTVGRLLSALKEQALVTYATSHRQHSFTATLLEVTTYSQAWQASDRLGAGQEQATGTAARAGYTGSSSEREIEKEKENAAEQLPLLPSPAPPARTAPPANAVAARRILALLKASCGLGPGAVNGREQGRLSVMLRAVADLPEAERRLEAHVEEIARVYREGKTPNPVACFLAQAPARLAAPASLAHRPDPAKPGLGKRITINDLNRLGIPYSGQDPEGHAAAMRKYRDLGYEIA